MKSAAGHGRDRSRPLLRRATAATTALITRVVGASRRLDPDALRTSGFAAAPSAASKPAPSVDAGARSSVREIVELLDCETRELMPLSDHLYAMVELAQHESDLSDEIFVRVDDLRWLLADYVINGGRLRRLMKLPDLVESLRRVETDPAISTQRDLNNLRCAADELLTRIAATNRITADWLIAHRVALPDPDILDTNALMNRYPRLDVEPTTVSTDPLYLLVCHIHDTLEAAENFSDLDHPILITLEAQLGAPIAAIQREVDASVAFNGALASAQSRAPASGAM